MPERFEMRLDSRHHMRDLGGIFEPLRSMSMLLPKAASPRWIVRPLKRVSERCIGTRATIAVGISDPRGLRPGAALQLNDSAIELGASADFGPLGRACMALSGSFASGGAVLAVVDVARQRSAVGPCR